MKIRDILQEQGVAEAIDIGSEWMTDTELDQYVPDQLQQQWRELVGYDEAGNVSALWANITGGYEPDVNDPEDRANMVRVANKWFAMKRIPNVRFFDVRDVGDELEWLVQIGSQGVSEAVDPGRRGFLAGMMGLAAQGIVPKPVAAVLTRELSTPAAAAGRLSTAAGLALFRVIKDQLNQYDGEDDDEYYEAWDNMAEELGIDNDELGELMEVYHTDPKAAAQQLMQHLEQAKIDPNTITVRPRDDWRYDERIEDGQVLQRNQDGDLEWMYPDDANAPGSESDAATQAAQAAASTVGRGQAAAMTGAAVSQFRDLVQRVMSAGQTSPAPGEPRVKDMGRIDPTTSVPALPAPDRSAADIMRDLQDRLGRPLNDQEKDIVQQKMVRGA